MVRNARLYIPPPLPLSFDENCSPFPYYFIVDEALPCSKYVMRPYPQRVLDNVKRICN